MGIFCWITMRQSFKHSVVDFIWIFLTSCFDTRYVFLCVTIILALLSVSRSTTISASQLSIWGIRHLQVLFRRWRKLRHLLRSVNSSHLNSRLPFNRILWHSFKKRREGSSKSCPLIYRRQCWHSPSYVRKWYSISIATQGCLVALSDTLLHYSRF